jgi:hypothetical protein
MFEIDSTIATYQKGDGQAEDPTVAFDVDETAWANTEAFARATTKVLALL